MKKETLEKDNEKLQHILEKLRKLMDLKESALKCGEVGEANAAAAGITRLLTEYDLTLQDIPSEQKVLDPIDIEVIPYKFPYMQLRWYWDLIDVVASHNNAEIIRTRYTNELDERVTEYSVIGRKKNREVVLYLISYLVQQFQSIGRRQYSEWKLNHIKRTGTTPPNMTAYMKNFLLGCSIGLNDKLEQEKKQFDQVKMTALVKTEKAALEAFMENMNVTEARQRIPELLEDIVREGVETGRNISIHKGVENSFEPVKCLN